MAIQTKKILSIAILASLLVFSFTVSSSASVAFDQSEVSSVGNQAAAQNSQDGNNDDQGAQKSLQCQATERVWNFNFLKE